MKVCFDPTNSRRYVASSDEGGGVETAVDLSNERQTLPKYGDENEGFSIDASGSLLVVSGWGFWSVELSTRFESVANDVLSSCTAERLILSLGGLRPLRGEGQEAFRSVITHALARGIFEVEFRSVSALTKLQMLRLCRELGALEKARFS